MPAQPDDPDGGAQPAPKVRPASGSDGVSSLASTNEELYGCLLAVNASITAGRGLRWFVLALVTAAALVGTNLGWFSSFAGPELDRVNVPWGWAILVAVMIALGAGMEALKARAAYRGRRAELLDTVRRSGLPHAVILTRIKDDFNLNAVARQMKKDGAFGEDLAAR
ncbi:MAG TPA: hypothetical protein PK280_00890 [Planctomycetota bacterium]|nr:hypothetical protein [Planctomycetota bacterium]